MRCSEVMTENMSFRVVGDESHVNLNSHSEDAVRRIPCKPELSFRGRRLLRLALNGYTQIQIEKILFPIMNFRFSPSARLAEESLANPNSHSEPLGDESHTRYKSKFAENLSLCSR